MCIICNLTKATARFPDTDANIEVAEEFLLAFAAARKAMAEATNAMRNCAQIDRKYDRTHKQMVRLCREWNAIEQTREADGKALRDAIDAKDRDRSAWGEA
jgi:hypothetical protein